MPALNIKTLSIKNFRSYGNYETELSLDKLGPVLILGEIAGNQAKSCGSGKSSVADAIIWCLFGRLPYKQRPADYIINNTIGKDCIVSITTCDGYKITRTRNLDGHNDLLIHSPGGMDISDSTNINAQRHLELLFNLDYHIFVSNVFFAQFGMPFLELPDQKRKKTLEKMLNLNKFDYYAEVAKEKISDLTQEQNILNAETQTIEREVNKTSQQIEDSISSRQKHEAQRELEVKVQEEKLSNIDGEYEQKLIDLQKQEATAQKELQEIITYDLDKLKLEWDKYTERIGKLTEAKDKLGNITNEIIKLKATKDSLSKEQYTYDSTKHDELTKVIAEATKELSTMPHFDIEALKQTWEKYEHKKKILDNAISNLNYKMMKINSEIENAMQYIEEWKSKHGKICIECKQEIKEEHTKTQCKSIQDNITKLNTEKEKHQVEMRQLEFANDKITKPTMTVPEAQLINNNHRSKTNELQMLKDNLAYIEKQKEDLKIKESDRTQKIGAIIQEILNKEKYVEKKDSEITRLKQSILPPQISIKEATAVKAQYDTKTREIKAIKASKTELMIQKQKMKDNIRDQIKQISDRENPYDKIIQKQKEDLEDIKGQRDIVKGKIDEFDLNIRLLDYIRLAYSDRKKIKAYILENLIPFFNERIAYYLGAMECDCQFKFTSTLQTKYDQWPYEMWSGGERKKIDLALMFAIYDLHTSIYDQQCNILVFDEVDGRLDEDGINKFVEVIFNELSANKRTILVISHKDQMRDTFPTKIMVKKDQNGFSRIEEVR